MSFWRSRGTRPEKNEILALKDQRKRCKDNRFKTTKKNN